MARKREFDFNKALEAAMHLFWEKGYEGTSYSDLSEATGLVRPSLYAAFGNKEELFLKVLEHYSQEETCFYAKALSQPTVKQVIEVFLNDTVTMVTQEGKPKGCLGINGALACSSEAAHLQQMLNQSRENAMKRLEERFEIGKAKGDFLIEDIDIKALAHLVFAVGQGAAVQAKAGVMREQLLEMVSLCLKTFVGVCK